MAENADIAVTPGDPWRCATCGYGREEHIYGQRRDCVWEPFIPEELSDEATTGLEARYHVEKINDPTGKHDGCRFFVLDPQHDPIAREALRDYAVHALSYGHVALYQDLDRWLTSLDEEADRA